MGQQISDKPDDISFKYECPP